MKIELSSPKQVRITWPAYDGAIEAQIVERLRTVPGIEGRGRRWYAPTIQTARLTELFPKASYDYDALRASDGLARMFFNMCVHLGTELTFDESGAIVAVGEGVSPLFQQLVTEREEALRPWVAAAHLHPRPNLYGYAPIQGPLTAEDARFEPLRKGIQNAKKAAEEREFRYPKRRRKAKVKQGRLKI